MSWKIIVILLVAIVGISLFYLSPINPFRVCHSDSECGGGLFCAYSASSIKNQNGICYPASPNEGKNCTSELASGWQNECGYGYACTRGFCAIAPPYCNESSFPTCQRIPGILPV